MNEDHRDNDWPEEAGRLEELPREMAPPAELEDRVTAKLVRRGLIRSDASSPDHFTMRRSAAAAAAILLLAGGFLAGGLLSSLRNDSGPSAEPTAAETYALLLYETEGYRPAAGAELLARYNEYGRWVAAVRERGQFVTGEDLAVDDGRLLRPDVTRPAVSRSVRPEASAPLSGIFLIEASGYDDAEELASRLPHLAHGGQVVIQRVIPTDRPPVVEPPPASDPG